jgi:hypothetical protein
MVLVQARTPKPTRVQMLTMALAPMLTMALMSAAAIGQETLTLPSKPESPRAGRVLELREVFRISDAQGGFFFKSPKNLQPAPDGGVMVVDDDEFLRFDAAGKFVVNMFRAGQGPGELRQIGDYLIRQDEVLAFQEYPMKGIVMGLDGRFLREFKPDAPVSRIIGPCGDRLLAAASAPPAFDKVQKPEGDFLDIVWTLKLMDAEGRVEATTLTFPTKWFVMRLSSAVIADYFTSLLSAPLGDGLVAVANEERYVVRIVDPAKNVVVRTIRRNYRRVKFAPEKSDDASGGARHLAPPRDYFNDIQKLFAVDGRIWVVTSTIEPGKGVLVDVISADGDYLDSFYLPLPKGADLHGLARYPLTVSGRTVLALETLENGLLEVIKYEMVN